MWGYFSGYGDMYGYGGLQQQNTNWNGGNQNQMASHYNQLQNPQNGAYLQMAMALQHPSLPPAKRVADCEGCGAPLKACIHHCEYCRRST